MIPTPTKARDVKALVLACLPSRARAMLPGDDEPVPFMLMVFFRVFLYGVVAGLFRACAALAGGAVSAGRPRRRRRVRRLAFVLLHPRNRPHLQRRLNPILLVGPFQS